MSQLRMRVLFAVVLSSASACGDDDSGKKSDGTGGSTTGTRDAGPLSGGDSGIGPQAVGDEGYPCQAASPDCNKGLICAENIFVDQNGQSIGVCGRSCKTDPDCKADEICYSYTGRDQDAHCVTQVTKEYGICGVGDTSVCKDRSCLYFPNSPFGVCIDTCALGAATDGGSGDDGGAPEGLPTGAVECANGETCVDGVLSDPTKNAQGKPLEGVCGNVIDRGGECGIDVGKYCMDNDICAPEDPTDLMSTPRCFENCGDDGSCSKGKCIVVMQQFAYCM